MNGMADRVRAWLRTSGFPDALLPRHVTGFAYDEHTGRFRVDLDRETRVDAAGDVVSFARTVTGILEPQRILALDGVRAGAGADRRVHGVSTDERRTTVTFDVSDGPVSVPYEALC